jgi:hypothetical protein
LNERQGDPPPEREAPEPDWRDEGEATQPDWRDEREWVQEEAAAQPLWTRLREAPSKLTSEQRLGGAAAIGIMVSMFLPWWRDPVFGLSYMAFNRFGWIELSLLVVAGSVLFALFRRAEGRVFHLPLSDGTLAAGAGIWCCVLLFARILGEPTRTVNGQTYGYDPRWGIFLCMLCAVTLAVAGVLGRQRRHRGEPEALAADEDANATFTG